MSAAIAFNVSFSVILLQLVQTRIFSVLFWNHLVYFIVSIALLGFGISGTWLSFERQSSLVRFLTVRKAAFGFVVSSLISSIFIGKMGITISTVLSENDMMVRMLAAYALATLPYFFAGWILGKVFKENVETFHVLYFADLAGAAVGCIAYLLFITPLGAVHLVTLSCALTSVPAAFDLRRIRSTWIPASLLAALFVTLIFLEPRLSRWIQPEATKAYTRLYGMLPKDDGKVVEKTEWNAISRIDVVSTVKNPKEKRIFIDGDAWTQIIVDPPTVPPAYDDHVESLTENRAPYLFHKSSEAILVIGAGGGVDVWNALRSGAKTIDAVEINPTTVRIGLVDYRKENGDLFRRPGVNLWNDEGRSFVSRTSKLYDVIMIHGIDTFAALNSGAYMLSENYLYTVDALRTYLDRLKPGGTLCITRWMHAGEGIRLFTTGLEALYRNGVAEPDRQIAVLASDWMTLLLKKSPFSTSEIKSLKALSKKTPASHLVFPGKPEGNEVGEILVEYADLRRQGLESKFLDEYYFDVSPTTDDSPFFFHSEKWKNVLKVGGEKGVTDWIRGDWPSFTLLGLFLISLIAVVLFIGVPLTMIPGMSSTPKFWLWIGYFSCLGVSFIFVEISLMQRFALLVGHPSRSIALVLATLLFSAGLGSFFTDRLRNRLEIFILGLVSAIVFAAVAYPALIESILGQSLLVRCLATVGMVFPVGFLMGMPFPFGLQAVSRMNRIAVPWMWGVNGGTTVLGSLLAIMFAMNFGFTTVLYVSAVGYLMALLCLTRVSKG